MIIKNSTIALILCCISYTTHARLFIKNESDMNIELNIPINKRLSKGDSHLFMKTPTNLAIRQIKPNNSKGPWYLLAGNLLKAWGQKIFTTEWKSQGNLIIHNSTKLNPLGWNIETYAN